jgi:uncharacterized integral membrane protein
MRVFCFLLLLAFAGAAAAFAFQNMHETTVTFFEYSLTGPIALVIGASFALGMLSGWSIVGIVRRSLSRVTEAPQRH